MVVVIEMAAQIERERERESELGVAHQSQSDGPLR
mgnify:CR=1 FL=1